MAKKLKNNSIHLFDSDDDGEVFSFKTNTGYAKHYDEFRKKEILSHLKNISDEEDTTDDDVSTDEELVNPEFDKEFFNALAFLKDKNPKKYNEIPKFFENMPTVEENVFNMKQQKKSHKPLTVADYQRERLIKTGGKMSDDDDDAEEDGNENQDLTYVAEQEKIRNELKNALNSSDEEEDDKLFKVRSKSSDEVQKEQKDYQKWLKSQEGSQSIRPLKDFWTSNNLSKDDKFLRDYILNQKYIDNGDESVLKDVVGISDDEQEVEKQDEYEHKYNFRYEEPDSEFIKRFPRKIDDSVRTENVKRKEKRKEREERKAKEKELKMKELRELQNIRKREIEEKLLILKDVAGKDEFTMKEDDLNSDFDPDEHDRRMSAIFDNEYYGIDEGDQKPQFPDIDEELNIENWDNFDKSKLPSRNDDEDENELHCEDDDFNMDCDYDPQEEKKQKLQQELIDMSKGRKRKKKISHLAALIKREKPVYDPSDGKSYAEYLDEYYKLDYEDIIGDQPCRFNYSECVPNDFGLSVEEILMASNKELNQWASLKKTMQNRPRNVELNDVEKYNRMKNNPSLKKKIFKSLYGEDEVSDDDDEEEEKKSEEKPDDEKVNNSKSENSESTVVKKKKKKNKKKNNLEAVPSKTIEQTSASKNNSKESNYVSVKKENNKKRKHESNESNNHSPQNFKRKKFDHKKNQNNKIAKNGERLKAFGINPKKFYNKAKYGNINQKKKNFAN